LALRPSGRGTAATFPSAVSKFTSVIPARPDCLVHVEAESCPERPRSGQRSGTGSADLPRGASWGAGSRSGREHERQDVARGSNSGRRSPGCTPWPGSGSMPWASRLRAASVPHAAAVHRASGSPTAPDWFASSGHQVTRGHVGARAAARTTESAVMAQRPYMRRRMVSPGPVPHPDLGVEPRFDLGWG